MKRILFLASLMLCSRLASGQTVADTGGKPTSSATATAGQLLTPSAEPSATARQLPPRPETQNTTTAAYMRMRVADEYLSPLSYSGWGVALQNRRGRKLLRCGGPWQQEWGGTLQYGRMLNPPRRNMVQALGVEYGWGASYELPLPRSVSDRLTLHLGAYANGDFMGRIISSSVNKPYSADIAAGIHASASAQLRLWQSRRTYGLLTYRLRLPVAGGMFMPEWGESYYELSNSLKHTIHFSSLHNRTGINHGLYFDLMLGRSSWRVGAEHDYLRYQASGLTIQRESIAFYAGWISFLSIRRGTR